jgi:hypothetical protein
VVVAAEVEVQDVVVGIGGVVEGVTIKIMTTLVLQKMEMSLLAIKDEIEAVEICERIPTVMIMLMW